MPEKKIYTKDDLLLGTNTVATQEGSVITHSHTIEFSRPLTEAEGHLFRSILIGFYHTVRFSGQFGGDFIAEPIVEFINPQKARYTFRQTSLNGTWKELLFAILANFSQDVAPISMHDESRAFALQTTPVITM